MVQATSTVSNHIGGPSALHITSDTTYAPLRADNGQEFLPSLIDLDPEYNNLKRATKGYITVIEMGLPTTGFMVQQFTNGNAAPGLLAQYGGLFTHKKVVVIEDPSAD